MILPQWTTVISRRKFLSHMTAGGIGVAASLSACNPGFNGKGPSPATNLPAAPAPPSDIRPGPDSTSTIDFASIGPEVPRLIFFPECKPSAAAVGPYCSQTSVRISSMEFGNPGDPGVKVTFSNGREITARGSVLSHLEAPRNTVRRDAVMLKSTVSWTLDWIFRQTQNRIAPGFYDRVKQDFLALQRLTVLEAVPIRALAALQKDIADRKNLRGIKWNKAAGSFTVE